MFSLLREKVERRFVEPNDRHETNIFVHSFEEMNNSLDLFRVWSMDDRRGCSRLSCVTISPSSASPPTIKNSTNFGRSSSRASNLLRPLNFVSGLTRTGSKLCLLRKCWRSSSRIDWMQMRVERMTDDHDLWSNDRRQIDQCFRDDQPKKDQFNVRLDRVRSDRRSFVSASRSSVDEDNFRKWVKHKFPQGLAKLELNLERLDKKQSGLVCSLDCQSTKQSCFVS